MKQHVDMLVNSSYDTVVWMETALLKFGIVCQLHRKTLLVYESLHVLLGFVDLSRYVNF